MEARYRGCGTHSKENLPYGIRQYVTSDNRTARQADLKRGNRGLFYGHLGQEDGFEAQIRQQKKVCEDGEKL